MKKSKEFLDVYLTGFLGRGMRMSMDEPTEQALADVLADFIGAMAANMCDAERSGLRHALYQQANDLAVILSTLMDVGEAE